MKRISTYALLAAGLLAVAAGIWKFSQNRFAPLAHLPSMDATVVSIDLRALRKAGLLSVLAAKPGAEEPDYAAFVQATGFDYQKDLDSALVAFAPNATFFLVTGRFEWKKLERYAKANGGGCYQELCHLPGSQPDRRISFLPVQGNMMGLAVSADDTAAARLRETNPGRDIQAPDDPVWMSVPASALKRTESMPAGTRLFAAAVAGADQVTLTIGPKDGNYAARLEAVCASAKDAQAISAQLSKITATLKEVAGKTKTPDELAGLLTGGTFQQTDRKVFGYWTIRKGLLENLAGGI